VSQLQPDDSHSNFPTALKQEGNFDPKDRPITSNVLPTPTDDLIFTHEKFIITESAFSPAKKERNPCPHQTKQIINTTNQTLPRAKTSFSPVNETPVPITTPRINRLPPITIVILRKNQKTRIIFTKKTSVSFRKSHTFIEN
jgi:hypothetical protein